VVLDQFSRRVVGWAIDRRNEATLVNDALAMAATSRVTSPSTILHSDHGSIHLVVVQPEPQASRATRLHGNDRRLPLNAVAESFFATIKRELIDTRAWPTRAGLRRAVFDYIEGWYNVRRLHSSLNYCSPAEYETIRRNADAQAA
jgi:transposase InsO family protein